MNPHLVRRSWIRDRLVPNVASARPTTNPATRARVATRATVTTLALLATLAAALLPVARAQTVPAARWPEPVRAALQQAGVPLEALAVAVLPAGPAGLGGPSGAPEAGKPQRLAALASRLGPRWLHQPDRPMQPASTMKLVTSVVALDRLGPNHRGFTELRSSARQDGEVLRGDLVLKGGADPELGLPQLWALLAELRHAGIREIAGDILLDRTLFRPARPELGVPPFDAHPEWYYNIIPDALNLNANQIGLEITSLPVPGVITAVGPAGGSLSATPPAAGASAGSPAAPASAAPAGGSPQAAPAGATITARTLPPLEGIRIDTSALVLTDRACKDWDDDWITPPRVAEVDGARQVTLRGGFARHCQQRLALELLDRNVQAEAQIRWVWQQLGGRWGGTVREGSATGDSRLLARRVSRPWGEVLRPLNKQSDNLLTRLLFLSMGQARQGSDMQTPTQELARREVTRWFTEHHIDPAGLVMDNGSGLSRSERITPRQMALLLKAAWGERLAPELLMSMPVVGVDGTMRNRLKAGPAAGAARMKTGTLRNVVALAGFVPDAQGRVWVMAAMVNHDNAPKARPVLDALVDWLAVAGPLPAARRLGTGPQGEGP